jgi:hypothetical protein
VTTGHVPPSTGDGREELLSAGLIVAVHPNVVPGYHLGAFSAPVQFRSVVAIAAVMCTVVADGREEPTVAHRDGGGESGA